MLKKFTSFVCVGGIATAFQYAILFFLVEIGDISPILSSTIGFFLSCILNYRLNYQFTFKSEKKHREAFFKFMIVACVGLCVNALVMYFFINFVNFSYFLSQIFATILVMVWNFFANLFWSFRYE